MNRQAAADRITQIVNVLQPDAYIRTSGGALGGNTSMCISYATSKTWANNIINNDPGHTHIWVHDAWDGTTGEQVNPFTLDSRMFGYSNYKTGYKNKCKFKKINKGTSWEKIEKALKSYFMEMRTAIAADARGPE